MGDHKASIDFSTGRMTVPTGNPSSRSSSSFQPVNSSTRAPPPFQTASFQTRFASLSMHQYDRIRLLEFPPEITALVRGAIHRSWHKGIQEERPYGGSQEFKLRGNPWSGQGDEAMHSRRLVLHMLETLWDAGWVMSLSTDISKKQLDKDTMIFRHQSPPPLPCDWMSISFSRHDRIRLMSCPLDLRGAIVAEIQPLVQQSNAYTSAPDTWEIKVRGTPWYPSGEATMTSRMLLLRLIGVLERFGYTVYASIDQKATTQENRSESDTWHCRRSKNWVAGEPVFHN